MTTETVWGRSGSTSRTRPIETIVAALADPPPRALIARPSAASRVRTRDNRTVTRPVPPRGDRLTVPLRLLDCARRPAVEHDLFNTIDVQVEAYGLESRAAVLSLGDGLIAPL